jgi:type VI secretion system protein VasJ
VESAPVVAAQAPETAQKQAQAAAAPQPTAQQPAPAVPEAPKVEKLESEQDARKAIDTSLKHLRQTSHFLLQLDLKNPLAYRYRRLGSWAEIEALPPNTEGNTRMPAPPPQLVAQITAQRDEANWPAVINSVEPMVYQYIFWFDLTFWTAEALKNLGPDYRAALEAVCLETAYLFQRFPDLMDLAFVDGTPFADDPTRKWIGSISFGEGGGKESGGAAYAVEEHHTAVVQAALAMARKKRVVDAVTLLQDQMKGAPSGARRMRWRLAIAQVLTVVKKSQLALPYIDQIIADIDTHHLDTWDPELAVEGLTMAWKLYNAQAGDDHKLRAVDILGRIATIDPGRALELQK